MDPVKEKIINQNVRFVLLTISSLNLNPGTLDLVEQSLKVVGENCFDAGKNIGLKQLESL